MVVQLEHVLAVQAWALVQVGSVPLVVKQAVVAMAVQLEAVELAAVKVPGMVLRCRLFPAASA